MFDPMVYLVQMVAARVAAPPAPVESRRQRRRAEAEQARIDQLHAEWNEARARAAATGRVV